MDLTVPVEYSRAGNTTHSGNVHAIQDDEKFSYGTTKNKIFSFIIFKVCYFRNCWIPIQVREASIHRLPVCLRCESSCAAAQLSYRSDDYSFTQSIM